MEISCEDALLDTAAPEMGNAILRHHIVHIVPWNRHHRTGLQHEQEILETPFLLWEAWKARMPLPPLECSAP